MDNIRIIHASVFLDASRFKSVAIKQNSTMKLVNVNDGLKLLSKILSSRYLLKVNLIILLEILLL